MNRPLTALLLTVAAFAPPPVARAQAAPDDAPTAILPGRPDRENAAGVSGARSQLGEPFESRTGGIAFRPPAGGVVHRGGGSDEVVRVIAKDGSWSLYVSRSTYDHDVPLVTYATRDATDASGRKAGEIEGGLLGDAVAELRRSGPHDLKIVRLDTTSVAGRMAGMLVSRFDAGVAGKHQPVLSQKAIVQADPTLAYTLTLMSRDPDPKSADVDARLRAATDLFAAVLDSVELLDQHEIRVDQEKRLYATRLLLVNLNDLTAKWVLETLAPERWVRVQQDGKDVGYSYVVEEQAPFAGQKGLQIGIRTRRVEGEGADRRQSDSASWLTTSSDRRHEKWTRVVHVTDAEGGVKKWREVGTSDTVEKRSAPSRPQFGQPQIEVRDVRTLEVTQVGEVENSGQPQQTDLPPWYLPQAAGYLLPRLVPYDKPRQFMFATYASESGRLMHRYVDVLAQRTVQLGGRAVRAVPIEDKLGLDGTVTTHYVSPEGQYLGSTSVVRDSTGRESTVTALPTTAAELQRIWVDAKLTRPEAPAEKEPSGLRSAVDK